MGWSGSLGDGRPARKPERRERMAQSARWPSAHPDAAGGATAVVAAAPPPTVKDLRPRYTFRRPAEVEAFLNAFPHRIPVLIEATEVIPRYFGPDAPLVLEVFTDPEDDDPVPELFALVQIDLDPTEALDRLDRLDDEWWTDRSPDGPGALIVDIEYG